MLPSSPSNSTKHNLEYIWNLSFFLSLSYPKVSKRGGTVLLLQIRVGIIGKGTKALRRMRERKKYFSTYMWWWRVRFIQGTENKELKSPSMTVKEESEKAGLKHNIKKTKIKKKKKKNNPLRSWHPVPPFHGKPKGIKWKKWQAFLWSKITVYGDYRLKLKKVEKTTRPLRYDLNQIPWLYSGNEE